MNTPAPARGTWDKVEFYTSYFLLTVLASVIGTRLGFDGVWQMPTVDLMLSIVALLLVIGSFWFARHHRRWRLWIIAFASATQLVPMVVREPVLLLPLLGALIPVAILVGCLVALSKKRPTVTRRAVPDRIAALAGMPPTVHPQIKSGAGSERSGAK